MHHAAKAGECRALGLLLDHGACLSDRSNEGLTPLHVAVQSGQLKATEFLLRARVLT